MGEAKRRKEAGLRLPRLSAPAAPRPIARIVVPAGPGPAQGEAAARIAAIAETVRVRVRARLVAASEAGSVAAGLDAIDAIGAAEVAHFEDELRRQGSGDPARRADMAAVQCRRGCAFCCHVNVDVTPLEAIRLARAIGRDAAERARVAARAANVAPHAPCPLLSETAACGAYDMRPFACRSLFSSDAGACASGYASATTSGEAVAVPSLDWPRHLAAGSIAGELAALDDLGLESHMTGLRGALAVLLGDAGAVLRWLNGGRVFPRRLGGAPPAPA